MSKAPNTGQAVVWAAGIIISLATTAPADPPRQADDLIKPLQAFADNLAQHVHGQVRLGDGVLFSEGGDLRTALPLSMRPMKVARW